MSTDRYPVLQRAYVLHRKPYRDSSLLVEIFSQEFGKVGLVARGARSKRSSLQALLQPFQPLLLSWKGRGELQTLTSAEPDGIPSALHGDAVLGGFYLNELLVRLLPRHDPHPLLYQTYLQTLSKLPESSRFEWTLRLFERDLLQELGYGLELTTDTQTGLPLKAESLYCYHPEYGVQQYMGSDRDCLAVHGSTLLALSDGAEAGQQALREAKRLMRTVLNGYLGSRPLASRELFKARSAYQNPVNTDENKE